MAEEQVTNNEENTVSSDNVFKPSYVQKRACEIAGLNWGDYDNASDLLAALEGKGYKINGNQVLDTSGAAVETVTPPENSGNEVLTVNADNNNAPSSQNSDDKDWIRRKAEYYNSIKDSLQNYQRDESFTEGFSATFNGAKVTYTAPDNVNVSSNAKIEVFETIVKDPENAGKNINFAEMPHDMAIRLAAACVLNGKKMSGNVPQFTPEDISMLRQELGARYAEFERKLRHREEPTDQNTDVAPKRNELSTKEFSDEDKQKISQALDNQVESAKLIRDKISFDNDGKPTSDDADALARYTELAKNDKTDKMMLAKYFYQNPEEFKGIIVAKLNEGGENNFTAEQTRIADKIEELKKRRDYRDSAPAGSTSFIEDRKARQAEIDSINRAKLGLSAEFTDSKGVKHSKLDGDALDSFIQKSKITAHTYERLGGTDADIKAKCNTLNPPSIANTHERTN